ncbi:hypothetical protein QJQ45_007643 [Haematococcus lacustris]|nr:hypothetical protein QJQ45_007643 [Haematococcus lacustris]
MWCPVVAPRKPLQAPCSNQEATQAAASEPGPSTPPPDKRSRRTEAEQAAEPNKGKGKGKGQGQGQGQGQGKAAKAKPAAQPGRWLDRDCNAALNMQRIGESRWRPLELCWARSTQALDYTRLRDKPPKAQVPAQHRGARAASDLKPAKTSFVVVVVWSAAIVQSGELRAAHIAAVMPAQGKLPAKGKEYPGLGYKRVQDKPPKAQQQQPAAAQ